MTKFTLNTFIIVLLLITALTSCSQKPTVEDTRPKVSAKLQSAMYLSLSHGYVANPGSAVVIRYVDRLLAVGDVVNLNGVNYIILEMEQPENECPFEGAECPNVQQYILEHDRMAEHI